MIAKRLFRASVAIGAFSAALAFCPKTAHARGCTEVSDIVGYEKCHRFGDGWAVEHRLPIAVALSLPYQTFDPNSTTFDFSKGKHDPDSFSLPGERLGATSLGGVGFNLRLEAFVWSWIYVGVEWGLAFGHNQVADFSAPVKNAPAQFSGSDAAVNTVMFHAGAFAGLRIPLGRISLRLEGLGGANTATVNLHSSQGDYLANAARGSLMPRAIVDVWASPNVTMSVFGGFNALDTQERTLGVMLELHMRSFDGAFSLW